MYGVGTHFRQAIRRPIGSTSGLRRPALRFQYVQERAMGAMIRMSLLTARTLRQVHVLAEPPVVRRDCRGSSMPLRNLDSVTFVLSPASAAVDSRQVIDKDI
jgi:hypothetical protein